MYQAKIPPIAVQTGIKVTLKSAMPNEISTAVIVVVNDSEGRELKKEFQVKGEYASYGKRQIEKLQKILGVASLKEAIGQEIGIHVERSEFVYKKGAKAGLAGTGWNIAGFFPVRYLEEVTSGAPEDEISF